MKTKIIVVIVLLITIFVSGCSTDSPTGGSTTGNVVSEENYVEIPISELSETAKFYSLNSNGKEVRYFVVKGSDGKIRTAFDACDVCGGAKGYRQEGNDMICNNCGRSFDIDSIGTKNIGGGCWPSYLTNKIEGDNVLISKSELAKGAFRF